LLVLSFICARERERRDLANALFAKAEDGELVAILPAIGPADASIAALATANRYDAIATFDQKLRKRLKDLGVPRTGNDQ